MSQYGGKKGFFCFSGEPTLNWNNNRQKHPRVTHKILLCGSGVIEACKLTDPATCELSRTNFPWVLYFCSLTSQLILLWFRVTQEIQGHMLLIFRNILSRIICINPKVIYFQTFLIFVLLIAEDLQGEWEAVFSWSTALCCKCWWFI